MRLSKSKVAKLQGGSESTHLETFQLIANKVAIMTVNAAKDGSIHTLALIIACKIHPKSEKFIKTICLGGNTDAIVNEIAKNL